MLSPAIANLPFIPTTTLVDKLNERDILLGRGTGPNDHGGNQWFRNLVNSRRSEYLQAETSAQQRKVFETIIALVHSNGGRFLKKVGSVKQQKKNKKHDGGSTSDTTTQRGASFIYEIVRDMKVLMDKTKQAFRYSKERPSSSLTVSDDTALALLSLSEIFIPDGAKTPTPPTQPPVLLPLQNPAFSVTTTRRDTATVISLLDEVTRSSSHQELSSALLIAHCWLSLLQQHDERKTAPSRSAPPAKERDQEVRANAGGNQYHHLLPPVYSTTFATNQDMFQRLLYPLHQLEMTKQPVTSLLPSTAVGDYSDTHTSLSSQPRHAPVSPASSCHGGSITASTTNTSIDSEPNMREPLDAQGDTAPAGRCQDAVGMMPSPTTASRLAVNWARMTSTTINRPVNKTAKLRRNPEDADGDTMNNRSSNRKQQEHQRRRVLEHDANFVRQFLLAKQKGRD